MVEDRFEAGRAVLARLDSQAEERIRAMSDGVAPDFARLTTEFAFGDILGRPGLGLRDRQIATIAALAAIGAEPQLALHVRYGLNVGLTEEEIAEILMQMAVYAGWPAAFNALRIAREVMEDERAPGAGSVATPAPGS